MLCMHQLPACPLPAAQCTLPLTPDPFRDGDGEPGPPVNPPPLQQSQGPKPHPIPESLVLSIFHLQ